ncbi:MAG: hypothetical protein LBC02_01595 [Planctomycetaceae bacterium]|nr:hypothetical protein [Planctomycetaceae bacterium]
MTNGCHHLAFQANTFVIAASAGQRPAVMKMMPFRQGEKMKCLHYY